MHYQSCFVQTHVDIFKQHLPQLVPLLQMSEFQESGGIRHLLLHEVDANEALEGIDVVDGILQPGVRWVEPDLK